ncbi:hypothetical protein RND71_006067 [Anisodus tanguticus]|uniref:Uncharacterized protein n=1 Tax=Anisodus tanguticus TaxID=243964 RepID=A0AAE1SSN4_9SOLA|nr:hypothetical protein RND71_006067 [Anisodus tanguticus]
MAGIVVDRMMKELHAQGQTIEDIEEVLKGVPIHPKIVPAIKSAYALGCDLRVVSDANVFFIEIILEHLGIRDYFSEINTNRGYVDDEGRLQILHYVDFHTSPHGCNLCPPNTCKEEKKRLIYLGDGSGDFCPSLKLGEGDFVMPRKYFPAWNLINENWTFVKASVHEWTDGEELEHVLLQLINTINIVESQMLSAECKFQTMPIAAHGALPWALPQPARSISIRIFSAICQMDLIEGNQKFKKVILGIIS